MQYLSGIATKSGMDKRTSMSLAGWHSGGDCVALWWTYGGIVVELCYSLVVPRFGTFMGLLRYHQYRGLEAKSTLPLPYVELY